MDGTRLSVGNKEHLETRNVVGLLAHGHRHFENHVVLVQLGNFVETGTEGVAVKQGKAPFKKVFIFGDFVLLQINAKFKGVLQRYVQLRMFQLTVFIVGIVVTSLVFEGKRLSV